MATPGRLQAPELNLRPSLNPAPVVNVVSVAPVNRQGAGSNLLRIADALAGLGSSIGSYGRTAAVASNKAGKEADANFVKTNQWRSPQDIVNQPGYDPHSEPQRVLVGQSVANEIGPQMKQWVMEEWDPKKEPDLYKFLAGRLGELQSSMDPAAQAGFGSTIDSSVRETLKWWDGVQNDEKNAAMKQNTFSHFISLNTLYKDLPVEERVKKMKEEGLDQYRMLKFADGKQSNDLLMNAIDYFAKTGDKDMVRALGTLRRGTGNEVPSLFDMPDYRDRVDQATATADAEWVKLNQAAVGDFEKQVEEITKTGDLNKLTELYNGPVGQKLFPNPAERGTKLRADEKKLNETILKNTVDAEKNAALEIHKGTVVRNFWNGNGGQNYGDITVTTKDGKVSTWNGQKEAQSALDENIRGMYEQTAGDPDATAQLDKDIARRAAQSPLKITEWENLFSGAVTSATTNALLEGKVPPNLKRAYELYVNTKDNPRARRANMGENADQTDTFFSLVDTFKTAGYEENQAFVAANQALPNANRALGRVSEELFGQNSSSYSIRDYPIAIQQRIVDRASAYLASDTMGQTKAVEKAIKDFEEEVVKIDDFGSRPSFINVPNKNISKDTLKSNISSFVQNQVALHGAQQNPPIDISNVNIVDYGNGRYGLQTNDGEPTPAFLTHRGGAQGKGTMFFTLDDVQMQVEADARQASTDLASQAGQADQRRNNLDKPIVEGGGSVIGSAVDAAGSWLKNNLPKPGQQDTQDTSILKGLTGNAEDAYGAKTVDGLRKLSDARLLEVYNLSKQGKMNLSRFVTDKTVAEEYGYRVRKSMKEAGITAEQVKAAMTRWSINNELDAIARLKANKAPKK